MKIGQLLEGLDIINISGDIAGDVSTLCYVSEKCENNSMFVAIAGLKYDGHDYIMDAIARGARFIVHEKDFKFPYHVTAVKVSDSRRSLGTLAANYFGRPSNDLCLTAVVGTNGKTTITYLMESILQAAGYRCGVLGTVNYRFNNNVCPAPNTTPESYEMQRILREMADGGVTHVIAEVSSHAVDLRRVDDCAFDLGIFTNLTRDHLDYHKTMENYYQAKKRFFAEVLPSAKKTAAKKMVINADDESGRRMIQELGQPAITYGLENESSIKAQDYNLSLAGIQATIRAEGENIKISSPLIGKFNLYNILAAAGAATLLKIPADKIKAGIEILFNVPGRLERVKTDSGFFVFVDYAHTDDALKNVLQNLAVLKKNKIITVFGCGGDRDHGKRPLMGAAATALSDFSIVTSDNPRSEDPLSIISEIENGIDTGIVKKVGGTERNTANSCRCYTVIPDRKKAIETAIALAAVGDIVLIAGKGHEDYQILGNVRMPFDDRVVAEAALKLRSRT